MLHEPAAQSGADYATGYKARLGVRMFVPYALFYAGFIAINLIRPVLMEAVIVFGLNLAVVYGFGLIVVALALALVYNYLCAKRESEMYAADPRGEGR